MRCIKSIFKIAFVTLFLITTQGSAQQEQSLIKTDEENAISIKDIKVDTKIIGDIAYTIYTIEVFNNLDRQLSGEIEFPLSDKQSIIGYALDIEGELRKAVGVDKVKGRTAYEDIVSRNVDPALLEKTEGNNFKTKIYPIPSQGSRIIELEVIENLVWANGSAAFELPVDFKEKIDKKEITIDFIGFSNELKLANYDSFVLKKDASSPTLFSTTATEIAIKITPKKKQFSFYQEHQGEYFYYNSAILTETPIALEQPKVINVLWDTSRSRKDLVLQEVEFLKTLSKRLKKVQFNIIHFNTSIIDTQTIKVRNGNTNKLEKYLTTLAYDGATQYGCIQELPEADFNILCSDGLGNFGDTKFLKSGITTYTVTAQTSFNASLLTSIARENGGVFINLQHQTPDSSVQRILQENTVFSGYKGKNIYSFYPPVNTKLTDNRFNSVARGKMSQELSIGFTKGNDITLTPLEIKKPTLDLKKYFAIQKVKELSINPEENKEELLRLGLRYNLLTDYTSLIVLETLEDYINNEIVPPNKDWEKLYYDNIQLAQLRLSLIHI